MSLRMSVCAALLALPLGAEEQSSLAARMLEATARSNGLCVLVNPSQSDLARDIGRRGLWTIQVVLDDAKRVTTMRSQVDRSGLYGRVSVTQASLADLPYAENLVNLLVVDDYSRLRKSGLTAGEVARVLAPYGTAWLHCASEKEAAEVRSALEALGWSKADMGSTADHWIHAAKPYPAEMDEWTHFRHNAEGNMVAEDTVVGPPRHVQWVAGPMWQRHHALTPGTTAMVGAHGRLFYIQDESPVGFAGAVGKWMLVARDAFNGKLLWERPMGAWGDEVWSWWSGGHGARGNSPACVTRRLAAGAAAVYVTLGFNAPVTALDPDTGKTLLEYEGTANTDELLFRDGVLYLSVNDRPQKPLPGVGFSCEPTARNSSVKTIRAVNAKTGELLWKSGPYSGVENRTDRMASMKPVLMMACEKGVFIFDGKSLVGLDLKTGKERFRVEARASSKSAVLYHKGVVIVGGKGSLSAFDAGSGALRWQGTLGSVGSDIAEAFAIGDLLWVGDGRKMEIKALDCATGEEKKRVSIAKVLANAGHHHRCYPNKSTTKYFIGGRRAAEFTNYETGEVTLNHWSRGACRYGLMPANGLLYKLPDPCSCYLQAKLLGFYALAPARTAAPVFERHGKREAPLVKGPAFGEATKPVSSLSGEWPTFRHDAMRSSSATTEAPGVLKKAWATELRGVPTPPVVAGGHVYVASPDEHKLLALDERTGASQWTHIAGGRVDSPPTVYGGMVLFGSADGWVTCLRASDGQCVWRFRAAPFDRRIVADGQVASAWPVHGSVLVGDGVVYCTAGRSSFVDGGIHLYALDAATGRVLGRNTVHEVQTRDRKSAKSMPGEAPGARSDILVSDGERVFMTYRALDFSVPFRKGSDGLFFGDGARLDTGSSFFDSFWFHRSCRHYGKAPGYMLAFDGQAAYSLCPFPKGGGSNQQLFVPVNGDTSRIPDSNKVSEKDTGIKHLAAVRKGGLFLQRFSGGKTECLTRDFAVCASAMVLTGKVLLVAGPVCAIDPADPWAYFEGRKPAVLAVASRVDGKVQAEYRLEALPVWNGMAAANGKVFISLKNGKLVCMGP